MKVQKNRIQEFPATASVTDLGLQQTISSRERFLRTLIRADLPYVGARAVLRCAAQFAQAQGVTLHLLRPHGTHSVAHPIAHHHDAGLELPSLGSAQPWPETVTPSLVCFRMRESNVAKDAFFPFADVRQQNILEFWAVPLRSRGRYLGWLGFYFLEETRACTQRRILLEEIGATFSSTLRGNIRRDTDSVRQALLLQSIRRTNKIFVTSRTSHQATSDAITEEIAASIGDSCALYLLDETSTELRCASVSKRNVEHLAPARVFSTYRIARETDDVIVKCAKHGESIFVPYAPAALASALVSPSPATEPMKIEGMGLLVCPIRVSDKILGVLVVTRAAERPRFQKSDLEWLELLADQAALGIENQRRFAAELAAQQKASRANFWLELRHKATNRFTDSQTQKGVFDVMQSAITWAFPETNPLLVSKRDMQEQNGKNIFSGQADDSFEPVFQLLEENGPSCDAAWQMFGREAAPAQLQAIWQPGWENVILCPLHHQQNVFGFFLVPFRHDASLGTEEIRYLQELTSKSCSALLRIDLLSQLRRSEQEATELSAMQNVLMGIVGHDLRNPLAAIRMGGGLLQQMLPNEVRALRLVRRIVRTAARAEGLIQQLLDFSVIHAGQVLPLKRSTGNASKWMEELVDEIRLSHPHRHIAVQVPENIHVSWDRERMAQAWSNLILNALHYGDAEREVRVEMCTGTDHVELRIWNHGPVLTTDGLARLFEPFERAQKQGSGCGLGLYIVREVVQSHGGRIDVHSADGQTCFTLRVPAADGRMNASAALSHGHNAERCWPQKAFGESFLLEHLEKQEVRAAVYA